MATRLAARLLGEPNVLAVLPIGAGMIAPGWWPFPVRHAWRRNCFTVMRRAYPSTLVGLLVGALTAFLSIVFGIQDSRLLERAMHHGVNPVCVCRRDR